MNQYIDLYNEVRSAISANAPAVVNARRQAAAEAFRRHGLPTHKDERFRYTDVAAAFATNYGFQLMPGAASAPDVPECYGTLARPDADGIVALNTMLAQDVSIVRIPAGEHRDNPLHIRHTTRATAPLLQVRRTLIVVEPGATLRIMLDEHADADQDYLTTQVTEIFVGEGAEVELYDIEDTPARHRRFHHLFADVAAGARFTHLAATLNCGLTRNQTDVTLSGPGAEATLLGCAIADARQHVANDTLIRHKAEACASHQLYKYVVDDNATAAFAGRILVEPGAQHTTSNERNANLVCASTARVWAQPMLEIYADDVECAHGSTVGQLNDDALFYMRQRGLSDAEARTLLKQAFAAEVINAVPLEALRPRLHTLVEKRFRSCEECRLCK
ncbi:MAG: Fe-S cluster assembly protein SufD [Bacteroidaceae bacterium]|nr:Fe-S cluster assembly protein SufD [Bacteroidaceae bacterium]